MELQQLSHTYGLDKQMDAGVFSLLPLCPECLWGWPSFLSSEYQKVYLVTPFKNRWSLSKHL